MSSWPWDSCWRPNCSSQEPWRTVVLVLPTSTSHWRGSSLQPDWPHQLVVCSQGRETWTSVCHFASFFPLSREIFLPGFPWYSACLPSSSWPPTEAELNCTHL